MVAQNYKKKPIPTIGIGYFNTSYYLNLYLFTSILSIQHQLIQLLKVILTISNTTYYCIHPNNYTSSTTIGI